MQVQRTDEQIARDNLEYAIEMAGRQVSMAQAKEIHKRHKGYAKRAKNLSGSKDAGMTSAAEYERLILIERLAEIDKYLESNSGN